jgi:hypothetical protein
MEMITEKLIQELLQVHQAPCLSLYMPTHRHHPDNQQDPLRLKNLLNEAEQSLSKKYSSEEIHKFLEPVNKLLNNANFWNHAMDGLGIFRSFDKFEFVKLPISVEALSIVADSFHTKPIRKYLQSVERFHLLGVSLHEIKLYEGNRHSLDEIDLKGDIDTTIEEALGSELTDEHITAASYGGTSGESSAMHHGHGSKKDEVDLDAERFFREISKQVEENYSKPFELPLILAALPEHHHLFHEVSKNPYLEPEGVKINPFALDKEELVKLAWEAMEPAYHANLKSLGERFSQAKAEAKGSDDYKELAIAAVEGRIDTLLVEADKVIEARISNLTTGNTQKKDLNDPRVDDLTDDMGELVLKMGGKVVIIPAEKMPTETGLAGIFRY